MTKVSVVPPTWAFNNNALFESRRLDNGAHSPNTHWLDCFAAVYQRAQELNIEFGTEDVVPIKDADIVVYVRALITPDEVITLKQKYPKLKAVLVTLETSLGGRFIFNTQNHKGLDAVITYNKRLVDNRKYFPLPPRAYYRDRIKTGLPFEDRRVGCLVGTNYKKRYRTGLFTMRRGWKFSLNDWIDYVFCPGQLVSYRARVAKTCARFEPGIFDLYGEGWEMFPETSRICLGIPAASTLSYLGKYRYYFAFENHTSDCGLISERIWDALWGDSVPVYLGHKHLDQFVPRECFIDASQFETPKQMLDWLCRSSKATWSKYRDAGREFIRSKEIEKFLPDAFAEQFLRQVIGVASKS